MAKLISSGRDVRYTILPIVFDMLLEKENFSSDYVLGYVIHNKETSSRKFTYTESGGLLDADNHWSLDVLNEFPYCHDEGAWIVFNCSPEKTPTEFNKVFKNDSESLHIYNWDIWSVDCKDSNVAVVTSLDIY
jgi:hypothetical protein